MQAAAAVGADYVLGDMPLEISREKMWATLPDWLYMTIIDRSIIKHQDELNSGRKERGLQPLLIEELSDDDRAWMQQCVRWDCEIFVMRILKTGWEDIEHSRKDVTVASRVRRAGGIHASAGVDVEAMAANGASADDIARAFRDWQVANARPEVTEAEMLNTYAMAPALGNVHYHERELYFALTLARSAAVRGKELVVGVVDANHLRGVLYALQHLPEPQKLLQ